ncbi:MAG: Rpn family recombination-promoting nuclease/putative transposase, partial [Balneolales bacterium]|nr:Rpn family recombination-promoting nuclease/putative transposase [Balneolales bacterium]
MPVRTGCPAAAACNVLVLLEVQHEPMASMPLRVLEYVSLAMSRSFRKHGVVIPVLPVVLYTGVRPWRMARSVRPLIQRPELIGPRFTPDLSFVLLEMGSLPLPPVEDADALNLATELVRVCTRVPLAELAPALRRLMEVAEARGELRAADAMASRLALTLARRHGQRPMGRKVDNMKALIRQTDEWLYQPGFDDLEKMVEEERALRMLEQRKRHEEQRKLHEEQRKRHEEQRKLHEEQRK